MALKRPNTRGSRYRSKIDPITLHVAYEGAEDEKVYFESLSHAIPKQFINLLKLIPVKKSSTASAPSKVYDDLCTHLEKHKVKLNRQSDFAFMVIDRDHHFSKGHQEGTRVAIKQCRQRSIEVLCSTPCFEIWLLCHYQDITEYDETFRTAALENKNDYLKKEVRKQKAGESIQAMLLRTQTALENEARLKALRTEDTIPPQQLQSNVGQIIQLMIDHGFPIIQALSGKS